MLYQRKWQGINIDTIHQNYNNLLDYGGHSLMIMRQMPTKARNVPKSYLS